MEIGYYNYCNSDGLNPIIISAKREGNKLTQYQDWPESNQKIPPVFLVNPKAQFEFADWEIINQCIQSHPETQFYMLMPPFDTTYIHNAQVCLKGKNNVEYIGMEESGKLLDIIEGKLPVRLK
jgi:hypothetical protein